MTTKYKFSNRILSLVLALIIMLGVTPITGLTVSAAAADDVWDGSKASQAWESGGGTATDPYVIMTAAQLAKLASNVNGGTVYNGVYFKLGANLDLNGSAKSWTSIGTSSSKYYFDGYFDGNNKTISNISQVSKYALFGYIGTNGKLTNLNVSNVTITTGRYAAGIVYYNKGTMENCSISNSTITTTSYAAGIVIDNYGTVTGCTASNVSISSKYIAAGLVAQNEGAITNCKVTSGELTGTNPGNTNDSWVGGICGTSRGGTISGCSNAASASANAGRYCAAAGIVAGPYKNGNNQSVQVTECANTGSITSSIYAGGISGRYEASAYINISNSYNTGAVTGSNAGGIAAVRPYKSSEKITNCYNAGSVTGTSYAGGIAGDGGNGIIENTHNYAKVVSGNVAGYIVASDAGSWPGVGKLINNYAIDGNAEGSSICKYLDTSISYADAVTVGSTVEEFKNGTIYELLQNANGSNQVWGQTIGTDNYPVFFNGTNLPVAHTHEFTYAASNNIITETCVNGCEHTETATLNAPTSEIVYDGTSKESATVSYSEGWQGGELAITYENNKNAGTATAKIQKEDAIASVNFVIKAAEPNEETPSSLVATYGDTLADVTLPSGWAWKDSSLSVGDVGNKTFKAVFTPSDSNYKTIEADVPVLVEQATPSYTTPIGLTATYGDRFFMIRLPNGWSWRAPTALVGDAGVHQYSAYYTPTDSNYKEVMVELTVTIMKADRSAPDTITKTDETISKKADGTISGITADMEYRKEGESLYEAVNSSILENLAAGKYYVRYQGDSNHNPSPDTEITIAAGRKLKITVPQNTVGYTVTTSANEVDYGGNATITLTVHDGYSKTDAFKLFSNGIDSTQYLIYNGTTFERAGLIVDIDITVEGIADITAPTAEIDVKGNKWTEFLSSITFGLFFKDTQDVTITVNDLGSGVSRIEYYLANGEMSMDELVALTEWEEYTGTFKINPNNRYVVYAKISDNAGNITYINSDGLVLDNVAPTLEGIENGKTYYGDLTVIKSEEQFYDIESVTLDGEPLGFLEGTYGLIPADNAEHTVVVKDRVGNTTTYTVTVMKNYTVTYKADGVIVSTQTVGHGKDATAPAIPEKVGYTKTAPVWDMDGKNITTDTEINAVYTANKYTVTIPSEQVGYTLETDVETIEHGGEVYISIVPKAGYEKTDKFALKVNGETVELTEYSNVIVTATEDLVITVEGIELKTYTITFKDENGVYKTLTYKHGETVVMPDVPTKEGYTVKWDTTLDKATGDITVNAVYTEIPKDNESENGQENKPTDTTSPQTGDNSNMALWIALLFVSGGALITLTVVERKRKVHSK